MRSMLPTAGEAATNCIVQPDSETLGPRIGADSTVRTGRESWRWFYEAAQGLLGPDAGLQLHYLTGYPERSCYRYASGERAPPADFLRKLFHHPEGAPFHDAFMHGCKAKWWVNLERDRKLAAVAHRFKTELDQIE